jgi:signal peptidase I
VLAALQAGAGDAAEVRADAADPGRPAPADSATPTMSVPAGRLRRARRWLFEQAPPNGPEAAGEAAEVQAGPSTVGDSAGAADGATYEAPYEAPDDGWTAAELAALRADVEPDPLVPVVDRTVTARGELARRLAAIHDDPDYDPAAVPVDGSEVRPTVAWDDLAAGASAVAGAAAEAAPAGPLPTTAVPEPAPTPELDPEAEPKRAPSAPPAADEASPVDEASAHRRPRPRPYAAAPVHYTDEPLPEAAPERPAETPEPAAAAPAGVHGAVARSRSDAPAAQEKLDKGGPARGRRTARWLIRTAVLVAIAVVTAVLLRAYVVSPYYIPSASMEPTLHGCSGCNNDHVLVDKLSYRMHDVHRGDVVVFHRPDTWQVPEKTLIKRVVGLPGDRLAVRDGKVYVNGLQLQESYLNADCPPMTSLSEDPGSSMRTYGPVPSGDLYVMGDNRCDSADSRAFGPVPTSDVIGRAFVIIWPLGRIHWL